MKKYLPYLAGILNATIFGFSFMFSKNALDSLTTIELLFCRFLTAAITMSLLILIGFIKVNFKGKNLKPLLLVAIWQPVIYFIMEASGLEHTTSSEAGVMMAFIPVLTTILALLILKEKSNKVQNLFIIISVIGVIIIVIAGGGSESGGQIEGLMFLLGAVLSAALFNIFSRKASNNFTTYEITYFMMCLGSLVYGIILLFQRLIYGRMELISKFTFGVTSSILYLGVLSSVAAFLLVNYTLSKLQASQSAVFANLTTVVSVVAGVTIRHESFQLYELIGAILIIFGVWGTNYFGLKKK